MYVNCQADHNSLKNSRLTHYKQGKINDQKTNQTNILTLMLILGYSDALIEI